MQTCYYLMASINQHTMYFHILVFKGYTTNQISLKALAKGMHLRDVDFNVHDTRQQDGYDLHVTGFLGYHVVTQLKKEDHVGNLSQYYCTKHTLCSLMPYENWDV